MSTAAPSRLTKEAASVQEFRPDEAENEYEDAENNFQPKSYKFWTILLGIYLSGFIVMLDRTIIAAAIPRMTDEFDSIQDIGWYGSAYMLAAACFMPISGRVYQLYSTKRVFLTSLVIFEAGSALCGAAPSSTAFIIGRAVAGLGSAFVFSGMTMIMLPLVPLRKRPVFMSLLGLAFGLSSVLGPVIGGAFTDHVSWRWCFYLNLPIGGFTLLAVLIFFQDEPPKGEKLTIFAQIKRLDPVGILFFVPSMVCLMLALQLGGSTSAWSAPKIIGLLVTFAITFVAFIAVEVTMPNTAMAPTRVVLNRSVAGSMLFMFLLSGSMMSIICYMTTWFQVVKGDSATESGVSTIPLLLSMIVINIAAAVGTQKLGYYVPAMLTAPVLLSVGAGMLSTLSPHSGHGAWIGYQALYGFGLGFGFQTCMLPAQNVLPRVDVPLGMAMMFFMQQLGGSIFLAVSQNIFSSRLVTRLSKVTQLDPHTIVNTGAIALRTVVPPSQFDVVVSAYNYALTRVFVVAAVASACMIIGALAVKWQKIQGKDGKKKSNAIVDTESQASETKEEPKV